MEEICRTNLAIIIKHLPHQELFSVRRCRVSFFGSQRLKVELEARVWVHHSTVLTDGNSFLNEGASEEVNPRAREECSR